MQENDTDTTPQGAADTVRQHFIGFVSDKDSAAVLQAAFAPVFPQGSPFHIVNFRTSLAILSRMRSPEILLVDLSGEDQPMNAMMDLAEVVEAGTTVLVTGAARDLSFYRAVVNGMGVKEYLAKPLNKTVVEKHFLPYVQQLTEPKGVRRGGRLITVCGTRGGIGTTTIAANLAWVISHELHRHAVLLDTDMHTGTAALSLNVNPGKGLVGALDTPERVDQMLIERVAQPAGERLHLMAVQEGLDKVFDYRTGSGPMLARMLRERFNFVVADCGARQIPFARELLETAQQRVVILDPSIMAIRNLERLNHLANKSTQSARTLLVLNQAGRAHGLTTSFMEETIGMKFDVVIPDLPRIVPKAEKYGDMAAQTRGAFRAGMLKLADSLGAKALLAAETKEAVPA
jgi:pilus assembly protein CpaE